MVALAPHSPTDLGCKNCIPLANAKEKFTLDFKAPYEGKGSEQGIIPKLDSKQINASLPRSKGLRYPLPLSII